MTDPRSHLRDLDALLASVCDQTAGADDIRRIEALAGDVEGLHHVLDYLQLDGLLRWEYGAGTADNKPSAEAGEPSSEITDSPLLLSPAATDLSPAIRHSPFSLQSPLGIFLFSYAASAVFFAIAFFFGWTLKISDLRQRNTEVVIERSRDGLRDRQSPAASPFVGRVTGLADCRWSDRQSETTKNAIVRIGRTYALSAGFLEITYDSGAKVILQGPCVYRVDSPRGGFLEVGKLTAKVGTRGERRGKRGVASGQ